MKNIFSTTLLLGALFSCNNESDEVKIVDKKFGEITSLSELEIPQNGRLQIGKLYTVPNNWAPSYWTKTGDFNGDGRDDIASIYSNQVLLKFSNGENINYATGETWYTNGAYSTGQWTFSGDFNGDGLSDIVSLSGGQALMKLNTGSINFNSKVWSLSNQWGGAGWTVVGDFDGDGDDDIASASGNKIYLKKSFGNGFSSHTFNTDGLYSNKAWWTFACDYNGDGLDDIVSLKGSNIYVKQSKVNSSGNFSGFISYIHLTTNIWGTNSFTWTGDTDGDGKDEILTAIADKIYVREWNGSNNWSAPTTSTNNYWGGSGWNWAMDYTGDGTSEVVSAIGSQLLLH